MRDVERIHDLLTTRFHFQNSDIVVLTDEPTNIEGVTSHWPTKRNILFYLDWLVSHRRPGDSLWFSFSGHGSQIPDHDWDEQDGLDEVLHPEDYHENGSIVDDQLYNDVVCKVPPGCRLTVLIDACHSGTALDLPYNHNEHSPPLGKPIARPGVRTPQSVARHLRAGHPRAALSSAFTHPGERPLPGDSSGLVLLFSSCMDDQQAADSAQATGFTMGAMTWAFTEAVRDVIPPGGAPVIGVRSSYREIHNIIRAKLRRHGWKQVPQFSTSHKFDYRNWFFAL